MSDVIKRYFIAEGLEAERVVAAGLAKIEESYAQRDALIEMFGAVNLYGYRHSSPFALVFDAAHAEQKDGFRKPEKRVTDGKVYYIHRPNKATRIGREVLALLQGYKPFNFSDFVVGEFDVDNAVIGSHPTGAAMYSSAAGYYKPHLILSIPFGGDTGGFKNEPPKIPGCFREIKKSEFIAITEEGGAA